MNTNLNQFNRSEFYDIISPVSMSHTWRNAQLDFFGPIALVCALGIIAHFVQSLLTN